MDVILPTKAQAHREISAGQARGKVYIVTGVDWGIGINLAHIISAKNAKVYYRAVLRITRQQP